MKSLLYSAFWLIAAHVLYTSAQTPVATVANTALPNYIRAPSPAPVAPNRKDRRGGGPSTKITTTITFATTGITVGTIAPSDLSKGMVSAISSACTAVASGYSCDESKTYNVAGKIMYKGSQGWDGGGSLDLRFKYGSFKDKNSLTAGAAALAAGAAQSMDKNCVQVKAINPIAKRIGGPPPIIQTTKTICKASAYWEFSTSESSAVSGQSAVHANNAMAFDIVFNVDPDDAFGCEFIFTLIKTITTAITTALGNPELSGVEIVLFSGAQQAACKGSGG